MKIPFSILLLLAFSTTSCSKQESWTQHQGNGYSLTFPKSWEYSDLNSALHANLYVDFAIQRKKQKEEDLLRANIVIGIEYVPHGVSDSGYLETQLATLKKSIAVESVSSTWTDTNLGGEKSYRLSIYPKYVDYEIVQYIIFSEFIPELGYVTGVKPRKSVCIVNVTLPSSESQKIRDAAQEIVSSFALNES